MVWHVYIRRLTLPAVLSESWMPLMFAFHVSYFTLILLPLC